jgi:hypothetical protein
VAATQGSPALASLSEEVAKSISEGVPAKAVIGGKGAAFAWTTGLARGFWSFCPTVSTEGGSLNTIVVSPSGTPAIKVAEGGTKPAAVTLTPRTVSLFKYAGLGSFSLEQQSYNAGLASSVTAAIVNSSLIALETDLGAEVVSKASSNITGDTSWGAAILRGIGRVAGNGGVPNMLAMNPADFAKALTTAPPALVFKGEDQVLSYLGLALHVTAGIAVGTAVVMDNQALLVAEHETSPVVIVDPFSGANTNTIRLVCDLMATGFVTHPGSVVSLSPTVALMDAQETRGKK